MTTKAITIRTETDTIARIDRLAKALDRSRNYVVNQAMISYVTRSSADPIPESISPASETGEAADASAPALVRKVKSKPKSKPKPSAKSPGKKKTKKKKKKSAKKSKK